MCWNINSCFFDNGIKGDGCLLCLKCGAFEVDSLQDSGVVGQVIVASLSQGMIIWARYLWISETTVSIKCE